MILKVKCDCDIYIQDVSERWITRLCFVFASKCHIFETPFVLTVLYDFNYEILNKS